MIGFLHIYLCNKFLFITCINRSNSNPNNIGSVGINKPKLFVYSSIFIERGVKKARPKKVYSVWNIAKYIAINPKEVKVK